MVAVLIASQGSPHSNESTPNKLPTYWPQRGSCDIFCFSITGECLPPSPSSSSAQNPAPTGILLTEPAHQLPCLQRPIPRQDAKGISTSISRASKKGSGPDHWGYHPSGHRHAHRPFLNRLADHPGRFYRSVANANAIHAQPGCHNASSAHSQSHYPNFNPDPDAHPTHTALTNRDERRPCPRLGNAHRK